MLVTALAFTTIFVTAKNLTIFAGQHTFDHGTVNAVIDNCSTVTVLNDKSFFLHGLSQTNSVGLVTVGGDNHKPTHIGTVTMAIRDDNEKLHKIKIPKAFYFPSSLVNVVSAGRLSVKFGDSVCTGDDGTCIKPTHNKSHFAQDNAYHRTLSHPSSGLPEITTNEGSIEKDAACFFTRDNIFLQQLCPSNPGCSTKTIFHAEVTRIVPSLQIDYDRVEQSMDNALITAGDKISTSMKKHAAAFDG